MKPIKTVLILALVFSLNVQGLLYAADVETNVGRVQDASGYTGTIPAGGESKGYIGSIISQIFYASGLIKNEFITAFQTIDGNFANNIPRWDGGKFVRGLIDDDGSTVTLGGNITASGVGRFDGGVGVNGVRSISDTNYSHNAQATDNTHYGFFEVRNDAGTRGAYFGYGNGGNRVNLAMESADRMNISGGRVGIGVNNPTQVLDVNGKIRMRSETIDSDADDTVVTKGYVDNYNGNNNVHAVSRSVDVTNGQLTGLIPGQQYLVSIFGGTINSTGLKIYNCSKTTVLSGTRDYASTGRGTQESHVLLVTAPDDGCIRGTTQGSGNRDAYHMTAWSIGYVNPSDIPGTNPEGIFDWGVGNWSACSGAMRCDGPAPGVISRSVTCYNLTTGVIANDNSCPSQKPSTTGSCSVPVNQVACNR